LPNAHYRAEASSVQPEHRRPTEGPLQDVPACSAMTAEPLGTAGPSCREPPGFARRGRTRTCHCAHCALMRTDPYSRTTTRNRLATAPRISRIPPVTARPGGYPDLRAVRSVGRSPTVAGAGLQPAFRRTPSGLTHVPGGALPDTALGSARRGVHRRCCPLPDPGIPTRASPSLSPQLVAVAGRPRAAHNCDLSMPHTLRVCLYPRRVTHRTCKNRGCGTRYRFRG
jgi:hypothetical protein